MLIAHGLPLSVFVSSMYLFAQSTGFDPAVVQLVSNLGIVGVLVWYLWYHTTHSYPKMIEKVDGIVNKINDAFLKDQREMRSTFSEEQRAQRVHDSQQREQQREFYLRENGELRAMLIQTLQSMRTAVHDVRDTAQAALIPAAAAFGKASDERKRRGQSNAPLTDHEIGVIKRTESTNE